MKTVSDTRSYKQTARALAAEETAERILVAFVARIERDWFDDVRLDDVAADAGVTVQTVIRRFGGKDGLLEAAGARLEQEIFRARQLPVGDVARAIDLLVSEYDAHGDFVMHTLGQEERYAPMRQLTDTGRAQHREWVRSIFAPWLDRLPATQRTPALDKLVIATDVYVWKLMRRDMDRSRETLVRTMIEFAAAALGIAPETLLKCPHPAPETIDD